MAARSVAPGDVFVRTEFAAADGTDHLDVLVQTRRADALERAESSQVLQALNAVAVPAGLTEDAPRESREGLLLVYRRSGVATHTVHVHSSFEPPASPATPRPPKRLAANEAKLAILLDDLGSDRVAADEIFAMPYPLTISVLPGHAHSAEIAKEAERRGYQVMLHLPMQSLGEEQAEPQELHSGMPATEVATLVDQFLRELPGVTGVNNHQGSQATSDPALMQELMPVLRERGLFYVDSRTTAATVAYNAARQDGVPAAFRNVPFLDDVENKAAIEKEIELALRGAREKGEAIAIGHPHPATLQALREMLPKAQAQGVTLVFVSDLVH
ncbi:MAG: divergent polysaccharide deacetylase family protein [Candidatus Acidiferrum sp.]